MRGIEFTPERPIDRVAELCARAEDAGFEAAFVASHYNNRDPFAALTMAAARTDRLRLGPAAATPIETHPAVLASRVATLAETSDGRAALGIGPGDPSTMRNLGLADDRGLRPVLEAFRVARRLWAGERVTHDGAFVCDDAGLNYDPPGSIPVYVSGEGPHMCRMAAKHADGLLFNGSHPADLAWARARVEEGLTERDDGDGEGPFELAAYASVAVAEDADRARAAARPAVAYITAGAAPPVLDRHGIDHDAAAAIGDAIAAGAFETAFERVTPAMIEAFSMAGTPATVRDRMDAVLEHADGIVVGSPIGPPDDLDRAVDLAGEVLRTATDADT